jgi:hypothetical protein
MERYHSERKKTQKNARLRQAGVKIAAEPEMEEEGGLPLDLLHSSP